MTYGHQLRGISPPLTRIVSQIICIGCSYFLFRVGQTPTKTLFSAYGNLASEAEYGSLVRMRKSGNEWKTVAERTLDVYLPKPIGKCSTSSNVLIPRSSVVGNCSKTAGAFSGIVTLFFLHCSVSNRRTPHRLTPEHKFGWQLGSR